MRDDEYAFGKPAQPSWPMLEEGSGVLAFCPSTLQGSESPVDVIDRKGLWIKIVADAFPQLLMSVVAWITQGFK